jgi:hypothetical protein
MGLARMPIRAGRSVNADAAIATESSTAISPQETVRMREADIDLSNMNDQPPRREYGLTRNGFALLRHA